MKNLKLPQQG
uniref:Uncharacterized protein n=1 Tax=Anguilla anguilla TaxID=7936 RepID=A0A0E9V9Y5_ANGAN